jgi:hypothetical protein
MRRLLLVAALAATACAPASPEQRQFAQERLSSQIRCEQVATGASGLPHHDAETLGRTGGVFVGQPSLMASFQIYRRTYTDCMAAAGFPGEYPGP